ncbi:winged helix-turn-helix domain-containing protein [Subtercola endophyticus]|uniref:winged helix-turn-helix domain-containing protein n=1 Tax=Subtercola endophyticus TaxID=2895559 RepID=UPI001E43B66F|nr:winged helix-turn-helix domain-containing protein [Subtercola endophyticus]UFS59142.1 winged helix-turn-helix domain-containing protein [Subtercola endophyticus]
MTGHDDTANEPAEARGFALYVGIDEFHALADGTTLTEMAAALKALVQRIAPSAQTYTSIAVAPSNAGGRDLDVVKRSSSQQVPLHSPNAGARVGAAAAHLGGGAGSAGSGSAAGGDDSETVVIDLSRQRMVIRGQVRMLTSMEFELLQYLVENEGSAVSRRELVGVLWSDESGDQASARTIDVHVRRLRVKLGAEADLVRTVHGVGYVFNRGSNVRIRPRRDAPQ